MTDMSLNFDHHDIDLLLPWYVNGTLDSVEQDRVANHVAVCAICRDSVSLLTGVQSAVANNIATPILPKPRVDEFQELIDARPSLQQRDWRRPGITLIVSAAALLLVFVLLFTILQDVADVPQRFETATTQQSAVTMDYVLSIQFESGVSLVDRERLLQLIEARDIYRGGEQNTYRVIVQLPSTSLEELEQYTDDLETLSEVKSVSVVALQLPMRRP